MLKGGAFLRATKCFNGSSTEGKALRRDAKSRIAPQLRPGALTRETQRRRKRNKVSVTVSVTVSVIQVSCKDLRAGGGGRKVV